MSWVQWAVLALVFLFVAGGAASLAMILVPDQTRRRLETVAGESRFETRAPADTVFDAPPGAPTGLLRRFSPLAVPTKETEQQKASLMLLQAGVRSAEATTSFYGLKALLTFVLPLLGLVLLSVGANSMSLSRMLFIVVLLAAVGFYAPTLVLKKKIEARQLEVFEGFPDALDLMTVCVEAGLGLELAMTRVSDDLLTKYPVLADEMRLVNLELRAGADREYAMRNLSRRTGVDEVQQFVTMILQAERFGTSIATSLRVLADQLRTKRRQRAEEKASKMAIKMLVPLIFCIFPALMVVLMGPAALQLIKTFSEMGAR